MTQQNHSLPEFDNPPVSEVAMSVEFAPIEKWRSPYAGLFWNEIVADYPDTEVHPYLPSQIERFGAELWDARPTFQFQINDPDSARFWFVGKSPTDLLQVQRDRFIINWRKVNFDEIYPRYKNGIRPRFERDLDRFKRFVGAHKLGTLNVRQCEITYVNDIPRGEGWDNVGDALRMLAPWSGKTSEEFLPAPETLSIAGSFLMPDERGRLHFWTQHLRRMFDDKEVVQLRLIARGKPASESDNDVLEWMDMGREWVVRGFTDLTTPKAHELWKRKV